MADLRFELRYTGSYADSHLLDLYDAGQALEGFQRTLAITTHLVLNGEVITKAPALKNAQIFSYPIEDGSWKTTAIVAIAGSSLLSVATASEKSFAGWMLKSAVSYVIEEATGAKIDYEDTLQEQLSEHRTLNGKKIDRSRLDSVIEKCETSITQIHRPIVKSKSASNAQITCRSPHIPLSPVAHLNKNTYEYISRTVKSDVRKYYRVKVSSYNINTFTGRIYSDEFGGRTVPFWLTDEARMPSAIELITKSISANAIDRKSLYGFIYFDCSLRESVNGRVKSLVVHEVLSANRFEQIE